MESSEKKALLVLGMHRSGTSALMQVLNRLGVELGFDSTQVRSREGCNHREHPGVLALHEKLLRSLGATWDDFRPFEPGWAALPPVKSFQEGLLGLLREEFAFAPLWGVKDPRLCRLVPAWQECLQALGVHPSVVLIYRNPKEVAESLRVRNGFTPEKSHLLWLRYLLDAVRNTAEMPRVVVGYETLLHDWRQVAERVGEKLELEWPTPPQVVEKEISSFISPLLRHHQFSGQQLLDDDNVSVWVKEAFRALENAAGSNGGQLFPLFQAIEEMLASSEKLFLPLLEVEEKTSPKGGTTAPAKEGVEKLPFTEKTPGTVPAPAGGEPTGQGFEMEGRAQAAQAPQAAPPSEKEEELWRSRVLLEEREKEVRQLQITLNLKEERIHQQTGMIDERDGEHGALREELRAHRERVVLLEGIETRQFARIKALETELKAIPNNEQSHRDRVELLKNLAVKNAEAIAIQKAAAEEGERLQEREAKLEALQAWAANVRETLREKENEIQASRAEIGRTAEELKNRETEIQALRAEIGRTAEELKNRETEFQTLRAESGRTAEELKNRETEFQTLRTEIGRTAEELKKRDSRVHTLENYFSWAQERVEAKGAEIKKLKEDLAVQGDEVVERGTKIDLLTKTAHKLKNRLREEVTRNRQATAKKSPPTRGVIRSLANSAPQIGPYLRWRTHRLSLEPLQDIRPAEGGFRSLSEDGQFMVRTAGTSFPRGWVQFSYMAETGGQPLQIKLYFDEGQGFSEKSVLHLPAHHNGRKDWLLWLSHGVKAVRLDPMEVLGTFNLKDLRFRELGTVQASTFLLDPKGWRLGFMPWRFPAAYWQASRKLRTVRASSTDNPVLVNGGSGGGVYGNWVENFDTLSEQDREAIRQRIGDMEHKPKFSVIMPVYNTPPKWLRASIQSVRNQLYPHFELCIADDASTESHVRKILREFERKDSRISVVYRSKNGHISAASNSALELATGEFIVLVDHDDLLPEHALFMVAEEINQHPDADLIYSDEDKIDEKGQRYNPFFKPDWSPDLFRSINCFSHLGVFRRSLVSRVGGFREGYEGSQDWDLALRAMEQTSSRAIRHIPRVLYHWRAIPGSAAVAPGAKPYALLSGQNAVREHLQRLGIQAEVKDGWKGRCVRVVYPLPKNPPLVSLIIPTRDKVEFLREVVDGILRKTLYRNFEILIVNNESREPGTKSYLESIASRPQVRVLDYEGEFNFSAINNFAVRHMRGEVAGLLNNDLKVISSGWLTELVSQVLRREIGAVGAKLLYPDNTVQHAGVVLGLGGVAAHAHKKLHKGNGGHGGRAVVIQNFSAVTAACMLVRRQVYEEVGGLDEQNLPVAFNDVDFCLRLREKGYRILWTPYAELYHLESASRGLDQDGERLRRFTGEIEYMKERWGHVLLNDPYYNPNLTLGSEDFALAFPPRGEKPWATSQTQEPSPLYPPGEEPQP